MDMLYLRLSVVNLMIAFVLFLSFAFEKFMLCFVRSIKYLNDIWFVLSHTHISYILYT